MRQGGIGVVCPFSPPSISAPLTEVLAEHPEGHDLCGLSEFLSRGPWGEFAILLLLINLHI
jgi:hypothetical protein